ncbi:transposable element tc1 transposase [Anaeramoeba flamelloides]|uniref:Transposable element tc1 transposase n=1 Tax=Anaeramoeba flamelloides TaxID=1746091 RepID=A0AAV7ZFY0_9EUKA|nr:transposable element tc1 transposase [Anaeramoeba flamelloides]
MIRNNFRLTQNEKVKIIEYNSLDYNIQDIAKEISCNAKTVRRVVQRWNEENTIENYIPTGRPKTISDLKRQKIIRIKPNKKKSEPEKQEERKRIKLEKERDEMIEKLKEKEQNRTKLENECDEMKKELREMSQDLNELYDEADDSEIKIKEKEEKESKLTEKEAIELTVERKMLDTEKWLDTIFNWEHS